MATNAERQKLYRQKLKAGSGESLGARLARFGQGVRDGVDSGELLGAAAEILRFAQGGGVLAHVGRVAALWVRSGKVDRLKGMADALAGEDARFCRAWGEFVAPVDASRLADLALLAEAGRLPPSETRPEAAEKPVEAPDADQATRQPDGPSGPSQGTLRGARGYPTAVKALAVRMQAAGEGNPAIIAAIADECGRAPDTTNIAASLRNWASNADVIAHNAALTP